MNIIEAEAIKQAIDLKFDLEKLIQLQKQAFIDFSNHNYDIPMPMQFIFSTFNTYCHIKAGYKQGSKSLVVKLANGGVFGNSGVILVFEADTGALKAILKDEGFLTTLRTAIAGIIVSEFIPWDTNNIGIIGSGNLAKMLHDLICLKYPNKNIMLYARDPQKAKLITKNIGDSVEKLVNNCDLIFTATASSQPLIQNINTRKNKAIIALGSDDAHKSELAPLLFNKSDLIMVDSKQQALQFGDVAKAITLGLISADSLVELGEVLKLGASGKTKTLIADFSGIAAQDVAITEFVLSKI